MQVLSKRKISKSEVPFVYDIMIQDNHNYVITKSDIVVHNSGKGFTINSLLGIKAKVIDPDELKRLALKTPNVRQKIQALTGKQDLNLKNPDDVYALHDAIGTKLAIPVAQKTALLNTVLSAPKDRLPNLIFDTTLSDLVKLDDIRRFLDQAGYERKNIHLVWVITDYELAKQQNAKRARVVPDNILHGTHTGASATISHLLNNPTLIQNYFDGDIWLSFNTANVDSKLVKSKDGGKYVEDALIFKLKEAGKPGLKPIPQELIGKIQSYVPNPEVWHNHSAQDTTNIMTRGD